MKEHAQKLLGIIQSFAPNGAAQEVAAQVYREADAKFPTDLELVRAMTNVLADGLNYGNWPWNVEVKVADPKLPIKKGLRPPSLEAIERVQGEIADLESKMRAAMDDLDVDKAREYLAQSQRRTADLGRMKGRYKAAHPEYVG
jgi:hypothetical protein